MNALFLKLAAVGEPFIAISASYGTEFPRKAYWAFPMHRATSDAPRFQ
jgi:hypothetical protein